MDRDAGFTNAGFNAREVETEKAGATTSRTAKLANDSHLLSRRIPHLIGAGISGPF